MKKIENWKKLLILLSLSLFLTGCQGFGGGGGSNDDVVAINTNFHTGTEGIKMRFENNAPPPVIFDTFGTSENEIVVLVELWNKGAYDTDVALYLGGFDPSIVLLPTTYGPSGRTELIPLRGKSLYNAEGETTLVQFPYETNPGTANGAINLPENADKYSPDLQLTACYKYETDATVMTCVAQDPYSLTAEQVCKPGTVTGGTGSQGAPISVSSVSAENIPGEVVFKIRLSNAGGGRVLSQNTVPPLGTSCPYDLNYLDLNVVDYEIRLGTGAAITSQNSGTHTADRYCEPTTVKLSNGNGIIYCRFPLTNPQESAYQVPLQVKLIYGYMDSQQKRVEIRNLNT